MSCRAQRLVLVVALALGVTQALGAQTPKRCQIRFSTQGVGGFVRSAAGELNWASGGVEMSCIGQQVFISTDSAVRYPNGDVDLVGRVRYRDTTVTIAANRATFRRNTEVWEARGNVAVQNLETGSTVSGPSIDYYRAVMGVRDSSEVLATGRPHVEYFDADSVSEGTREPYRIDADRLRARGKSLIWAGGRVTIDRSDLAASADSMRLDTGERDDGTLLGGDPVFRGLGADSFEVRGRRIDFRLHEREVTWVLASDSAHVKQREWILDADTIAVGVEDRGVQRLDAWGTVRRAVGASESYDIRGDSVVVETPGEVLLGLQAHGDAWLGGAVDSALGERDWLSGDIVVAEFVRDESDSTGSRLTELTAAGDARSFQVTEGESAGEPPSLAYVRGNSITVRMRAEGPEKVDRVEVTGQVEGVQLDPAGSAAPLRPR